MLKLYFVCLTYLFITDIVRCKPDYLFNRDVGGWLKLHTIPVIWEEAFLRCHYEGAVLASPLNKQLAKALHLLMSEYSVNRHIFLGTHSLYSKGDFVSVEGVPLSDMEIRWNSIGKEVGTGDCLAMSIDRHVYYMYTSSCQDSLPYICYKKFDNQTMNECGTFDNEYHFNQDTGSCYKMHQKKQTWSRAYKICASEGSHLVVLNNKLEARTIKDMFPVRAGKVSQWEKLHIGLLAWGEERTWITIHGHKIEDVFNDWNPGQPDNYGGEQDCATLLRSGTLDDVWSGAKAMFVCEKSNESIRFEAHQSNIEKLKQQTIPMTKGIYLT